MQLQETVGRRRSGKRRVVSDRPPVFKAFQVLGVSDADLADALNVSAMAVSKWARGPLAFPRHVMLLFVAARLCGTVGRRNPLSSRLARRAQATAAAAQLYLDLAKAELVEDHGDLLVDGDWPREVVAPAAARGEEAVRRLEERLEPRQ